MATTQIVIGCPLCAQTRTMPDVTTPEGWGMIQTFGPPNIGSGAAYFCPNDWKTKVEPALRGLQMIP